MQNPKHDSKWLDDALLDARRQLDERPSIVGDVRERVANTSMPGVRRGSPWFVAGIALIATLTATVHFWPARRPASPVAAGTEVNQPATPPRLRVEFEGFALTTHVAAVVEPRTVLVAWSGPATPPSPAGTRSGKYRRYPLPGGNLRDGSGVTFCVYVADEGVIPTLEPPTVYADVGGGRSVGFRVSPQSILPGELTHTLQAAGIDLGRGPASDMNREVHDVVR